MIINLLYIQPSCDKSNALPYTSMKSLLKREPSGCPQLWLANFTDTFFINKLTLLSLSLEINNKITIMMIYKILKDKVIRVNKFTNDKINIM